MEKLEPPDELGAAGTALWDAVTGRFKLDGHEHALLVEAVRTVDNCVALDKLVRSQGHCIDTPQGMRPHPALTEGRQQRITLARLVGALGLPDTAEGGGRAAGRKSDGGVRGVYSVRPSA